jgi:SAM-dependent methyltransferase
MDLPEPVRRALFDAAAGAIDFNAPLGRARAESLVERLARFPISSVVDLGCGRGELARLVAAGLPRARVTGIDTDRWAIEAARALTDARSLGHRVTFTVADASRWVEATDAALCIGASHAFGGPSAMLRALTDIAPAGPVVVGDAIWMSAPDPWCVEAFGELPDGPEALAALAVDNGWTVVGLETSTLAEWDEFERGWIAGVRSVGTAEADALADERERQYRAWRGVLGFCWLILTGRG